MQLHLFPHIHRQVLLTADSPKKAFYRLMIVEAMGEIFIVKESGYGAKLLDKRTWKMKDMTAATKRYNQILRKKLNPSRKSTRIYKRVA